MALASPARALAAATCGFDFLVAHQECTAGEPKSERNQRVCQEVAAALAQVLTLCLCVTASACSGERFRQHIKVSSVHPLASPTAHALKTWPASEARPDLAVTLDCTHALGIHVTEGESTEMSPTKKAR